MPEILENGTSTTEDQPTIVESHNTVDIETLKHAAKLESANLIAAERNAEELEIPKIEVEVAPPVSEEPEDEHFESNGNSTVETAPQIVEYENGNTEPEPAENGHHNGNTESEQNGENGQQLELVCSIVSLQTSEPEGEVEPVVQEQPDIICSMVVKEKHVPHEPIVEPKEEPQPKEEPEPKEGAEPKPEPEMYREPVVCEMKAKFTEPKVQPVASLVTNGVGAKKGNLNTKLDSASLKESYEAVRSDQDDTEWAVFKFDGATLTTSAVGTDFPSFQQQFGDAERAFAYIRIQTGDEMSKRQKFLLITWIGPEVSVLQRAKMSTDKAFVKTVVSNFAVELQPETLSEINLEHFVNELDKAGGAHYGTGV